MQTVSRKYRCPLMRGVIDLWTRHKNDAPKHALTNARRSASMLHARLSADTHRWAVYLMQDFQRGCQCF